MDEHLRTPKIDFLYAYGLYLAHGGTPENFRKMRQDDVCIMFNSIQALHKNNTKDIIQGIAILLKNITKE